MGWAGADRVDPLCLETAAEIWTTRGILPFALQVVSDAELPEETCLTTYDGSKILVKISQHVRHRALMGDGLARFTIACELGHATLHLDALMEEPIPYSRWAEDMSGMRGPVFCSARWQARIFAAAFLIHDDTAWTLPTFDEVSVRYGIAWLAAKNYLALTQHATQRAQDRELDGEFGQEISSTRPASYRPGHILPPR